MKKKIKNDYEIQIDLEQVEEYEFEKTLNKVQSAVENDELLVVGKKKLRVKKENRNGKE